MRKAMLAICTLLAISSFAIAQTNSSTSTSSSGMQSTASSSSFSCPCHTTQTSAENSINQFHKECKEKNGEDSFSMKKMSENCFCIEGACDIHYSSASIDTISYSSSSSSIVISSSSEYIYTGGVCYIDSVYYEGVKNVPTVHRGLYSVLPYMKNADNIKVSKCSCNQDGSFKCNYSNFGVPIGYKPIDIPLCGLRNAYWCPGIDDGMCDYSGSSIEIYHSDQYWKTDYTWGVKNFSNNGVFEINDGSQPLYVVTTDNERYLFFWMNRPLPQNINTFDLEDAFLKAYPRFPSVDKMNEYCRGEWFPHDEDCFGYASEVEIALQDSIDNCALSMGISKYDTTLSDRGWCVVGTCEPGEDPYYSSSSYASSSSSEESSSSSEFGLCQSLPFGYIPSDPKNTCFESNGKCYRCNAARRADECDEEWMWIYPYTPDKYFFTEIDCISGERKDNNRIGQCPGFPMETAPYNPEQACVAHNGKCYRCKSENSYVNCSYDWLWTGENFGTHNIGSWYEEVDCDDPFEEKTSEVCYEIDLSENRTALLKRSEYDFMPYNSSADVDYGYEQISSSNSHYDVLGRNLKYSINLNLDYIVYKKISTKMRYQSMRMLAKSTVLSGYVEGKPIMNICLKENKQEGVIKSFIINGSLRISVGKLHYEGNDANLIAHEKRHKEIWSDSKYNKSWNQTISTTTSESAYNTCVSAFDRLWGFDVRDLLAELYQRQNDWDDEDKNNTCNSRIDINAELVKNYDNLKSICNKYLNNK